MKILCFSIFRCLASNCQWWISAATCWPPAATHLCCKSVGRKVCLPSGTELNEVINKIINKLLSKMILFALLVLWSFLADLNMKQNIEMFSVFFWFLYIFLLFSFKCFCEFVSFNSLIFTWSSFSEAETSRWRPKQSSSFFLPSWFLFWWNFKDGCGENCSDWDSNIWEKQTNPGREAAEFVQVFKDENKTKRRSNFNQRVQSMSEPGPGLEHTARLIGPPPWAAHKSTAGSIVLWRQGALFEKLTKITLKQKWAPGFSKVGIWVSTVRN